MRAALGGLVAAALLGAAWPAAAGAPTPEQKRRAGALAKEAYFQIENAPLHPAAMQKAYDTVQRAAALDPSEPWVGLATSMGTFASAYRIGQWCNMTAFDFEQLKQAAEIAARVYKAAPEAEHVRAHHARLVALLGRHDEAEVLLQVAKQNEPKSFYPWFYEGQLNEQRSRWAAASRSFDEAETRMSKPHHRRLLLIHRADVAKSTGDLVAEEKLHKQELQAYPKDGYAHGRYASLLERRGRFDEAIKEWELAVKLANFPEAERRLERCKEKRAKKLAGPDD